MELQGSLPATARLRSDVRRPLFEVPKIRVDLRHLRPERKNPVIGYATSDWSAVFTRILPPRILGATKPQPEATTKARRHKGKDFSWYLCVLMVQKPSWCDSCLGQYSITGSVGRWRAVNDPTSSPTTFFPSRYDTHKRQRCKRCRIGISPKR